MKMHIVAILAAAAVSAACGAEYYVDANNGNDAWDGTTAAIPTQEIIDQGGTIAGPRKTLHAMMQDDRVVAGDTVWAAEGDYNEGGTTNGTKVTINRVQVKAGVMLRASGARDATFISGSGGTYAAGAVRCVYFLAPPDGATYACGIVKGFILRNGRTANTSEHGGASTGSGLLVECDLRGNGCGDSSRGGTMNGGNALRCRFTSSNRGFIAFSGTKVIDSLVVVSGAFYSSCATYNCTFSGDGYHRNGSSFNCLYIGAGAANNAQSVNGANPAKHYCSFSRSDFNLSNCTTNGTCRVVTAAETPYDTTTFRPLAGSVAIDAGVMSHYVSATNGWKAAWLAECGKDYYGGARVVNGTIDVGCGEAQEGMTVTISDDSDGLVVTGATIGTTNIPAGTSIDVTFSRSFTADRLCAGVKVNGVFHSFGGTTGDVPYAVKLSAAAGDCNVSAVYETQKDWYVSPTGDNANKGYHKNCPRRTLDAAMELATANAGHVVHAAAGVYDEFAEGADARSRVVVKAGVGLVADEWPLRDTVIKGARATVGADAYGNGSNAVRCVYVNTGGYVRGFKLTGGRTVRESNEGPGSGGGATNGGALIDCEVTGNGCNYRGRAVNGGGTLIRCYVHDQECGSYDVYNGNLVDSYIKGPGGSSFAYYGTSSYALNSTVLGGDMRSSKGYLRAYNSYLEKASGADASASGVICTNCAFTLSASSAMAANSSYDTNTCVFSVASANNLGENCRPKTAASPLVDAGNKALYDACFPKAWAQFKDCDFANGQRIYNGQIDIGCGEYDFRGDFAKMLGPRAVISEMGPNVTTNAVPNVAVPDGESITLSVPSRNPGKETLYELVYTPDGGAQTLVSEKSADGFLRTLDGACTVQSLLVRNGFLIMFQ